MRLVHFPITYIFTAHLCSILKGNSPSYWANKLLKYRIVSHCRCKHCYTFSVETDEAFDDFDIGDCIVFFKHTMVILHHNDNGTLKEIEIPTCDDIVPYHDEYFEYFNTEYDSSHCINEAEKIVKIWIEGAWNSSGFETLSTTLR